MTAADAGRAKARPAYHSRWTRPSRAGCCTSGTTPSAVRWPSWGCPWRCGSAPRPGRAGAGHAGDDLVELVDQVVDRETARSQEVLLRGTNGQLLAVVEAPDGALYSRRATATDEATPAPTTTRSCVSFLRRGECRRRRQRCGGVRGRHRARLTSTSPFRPRSQRLNRIATPSPGRWVGWHSPPKSCKTEFSNARDAAASARRLCLR